MKIHILLFMLLYLFAAALNPGLASSLINCDSVEVQTGEEKYIPVNSNFGRNGYIEYLTGNIPVVISVPHGGYLIPEEIKDRQRSSLKQDKKTLEIALLIRQYFYEITGRYPYMILNKLHRIKLDPNRELETAVQGDSLAEIAYKEFHDFIQRAENDIEEKWGKGFYIDLHAHRHKNQMVELGYLLETELLNYPDEDLNNDLFIEKSSIKNMARSSTYKFSELIRGKVSFGAMLQEYGYNTVPGPAFLFPSSESFFPGGYNTLTHGSGDTNSFSAMQIELPFDKVRDTEENIDKISKILVEIIIKYMKIHYGFDLRNMN